MADSDEQTQPRTAEHARLSQAPRGEDEWRLWGPYVSGRQWGTVREDYSPDGEAWDFFPFDHAHTRAYRWGEDGIAGLTDRYGFLNVGLAVWNGQDDRLKERLFGLSGPEGNHGEDAKEYWWHLDATPTHSFAEYLYRYPQAAFPYEQLVAENAARGFGDPEFELTDTGVLAEDRFFDVVVRHAKATPTDIVIEIEATNHGPEAAPLHLAPHVWFRNTWSWGRDERYPHITAGGDDSHPTLVTDHDWLGRYHVVASEGARILLCDNETNQLATFGTEDDQPEHPKDAINNAIVHGDESALAAGTGTKAAFWWQFDAVAPGESVTVRLRLVREDGLGGAPATLDDAADVLGRARHESDEFYAAVIPADIGDEDRLIARRAFAGLMWCKQLYRFDVREWLDGDPGQLPAPLERRRPEPEGRNTSWSHLALADVISMPDEWEYPWFATWDLAFHCVALAHVDPAFAKEQLVLMCREWAMHPNGQMAAYEWNFSDVNPPVHAWAVWQVYSLDGAKDHHFLVRAFTKLLLNFGWWVNRKDSDGSNLFEGGFLGMDNIGPFDRSQPMPDGQRLEQSDATSWMAFFCLNMLRISWELARVDPAWDETATKFLEHFLSIADAMENFGTTNISLWDDEDGFFYDSIVDDSGTQTRIRIRSMVGLLPLMAVAVEPDWVPAELTDFTARLQWLLQRRPELTEGVVHTEYEGQPDTTLSLLPPDRLGRVLARMLDEGEFLAPHGIRSLSAAYRDGTSVTIAGEDLPVRYAPAESENGMFGGNSNWRGPVWFPVNVLLTDALRTYAVDMAREFTVEFPTGSGQQTPLREVALGLEQRLISLFRVGDDGRRPSDPRHVPTGPLWQAHPTFSEYFDGDTGSGIGASHQTGWTALVAHLILTAHRDIRIEREDNA
ncbi:MGH1-like glycoside hydrolase domain-containing protein [Janibacter sp. G56]|uniref:MGH1-like glycoside hydrolase domain-containing protein n=1 Tax=Janibacter sp. G56 TaxID=3418717 RepID=UPI003D01239F